MQSASYGDPPASPILRSLRGLLWLAAWLLSGGVVDRLVCRAPETPAPFQVASCVAFGLLTCHILLRISAAAGFGAASERSRRDRWEFFAPVAAYSFLWGRQHFLNFFYWDEFMRFRATRFAPWELGSILFAPIGHDHVMPLARLYWYAIYSTFGSNYIGVAAGSFVLAVASIASAHALIRAVSPPWARLVSLVPATILAATPHSPLVTLWKGAGDSLVLALASFFPALVLLAHVVLGKMASGRRVFIWITTGMAASVVSSSLLTIVAVYVLPFWLGLAVAHGPRRQRAHFLGALFAVTAAVSISFWSLRQFAIGLAFPARPWTWAAAAGSLRGVLEIYLPSVVLRIAFVTGSLAMGIWLLTGLYDAFRRPSGRIGTNVDPAVMLWALGIELFLIGTLQIVVARGLTYERCRMMSGYHLFLPCWGLALACAAMAVVGGTRAASAWSRWERTRSNQARAALNLLVAAGLTLYCVFQRDRVERLWPLLTAYPLADACAPEPLPSGRTRITVIQARAELASDLRRFLEGAVAVARREGLRKKAIPDLALVDSPRFAELVLWPSSMNTHPIYSSQWRTISRLLCQVQIHGLQAWIAPASPIRLLAPERIDRATLASLYRDAATGAFLRKYWPQLEPETTR